MSTRKGGGSWARIASIAPEALGEPSLQLHWAAQLVASAGQTFAEPRDDESHRAMTWSDSLSALVGADFAGPYPFRVALRLRDLTLLLLDRTDQTLGALPLLGRSTAEGYDWLAVAMATYLGGNPPRIERPEYEVPAHPVAEEGRFGVADDALAALTTLYGGAAELLREIVDRRSDASEVRCWPHHFDIATLLTLEPARDEASSGTIGVGLAPMGGGYESWYWYVTPRPYPNPDALPAIEGPGEWHTDGWTGAVLRGEAVAAAKPARRRPMIRAFLEYAIDACEGALSP